MVATVNICLLYASGVYIDDAVNVRAGAFLTRNSSLYSWRRPALYFDFGIRRALSHKTGTGTKIAGQTDSFIAPTNLP